MNAPRTATDTNRTKKKLKPDSLGQHLLGAGTAVAKVCAGVALPQALVRAFSQEIAYSSSDRGAIQDIAYRTMRSLGLCNKLIEMLIPKMPASPLLRSLICCALSLMARQEDSSSIKQYDDFTVVDQAVEAVASCRSIQHAKGMVNAVLRRFLRERATLMSSALADLEAHWNYPIWWINDLQAAYAQEWAAILSSGNRQPPLTLRVNCRKTTVVQYLQRLSEEAIDARQVGPDAVRLLQPVPVTQIPGFSSGDVSVQDAAAQLATGLLDVRDGMRVLDACAAPGGKTCHILERAKVDLVALDIDSERLVRIEENLIRLGLSATLKLGDASSTQWWDGQLFDLIMADVPCTASGIVRRHPDIRWLRRKDDAAKLAILSATILDNVWRMLKPGGRLLLVTCSIWPIESSVQADAFAKRHNAIRLPSPGQLLPAVSEGSDHDGLFYALFEKPFD